MKVIYNKKVHNKLWNKAKKRNNDLNFNELKIKCPALEHQILKTYQEGNNIQAAVFFECVFISNIC